MILSYYRINYLNEFKNVTFSKEVKYFKMNEISLWKIAAFLVYLENDKNYICSIDFVSNITEYKNRFHKNISEPFLINGFSSPYLIYELIDKNLRNKVSFRSIIQIQYSEIYNID
jgi:hypothetical protein